MWGWVKRAARAVGNFVRGVASSLVQTVKWLGNTLLGLGDFVLTLLGIMPWKKIRVQAVVLLEGRQPVADRDDVQKVVDLAAQVFAQELKVRLIQPFRRVTLEPESAPADALEVGCDAAIWGAQFTSAGAWFRSHQVPSPFGTFFGYGAPVTVFVVKDVRGKSGCAPPGFLADYAVIDPAALAGAEDMRLTFAHEVGHTCNLTHLRARGTLMQGDHLGRPRRLKRTQKAIFRGSPHVTYL